MKHTYIETKNKVKVEVTFDPRTTDIKGYYTSLKEDFKNVALSNIGYWYVHKMAIHFFRQAPLTDKVEETYELV